MEDLKSNAEIRTEAADWVGGMKATVEADASRKAVVWGPFLEPWTHAVTIGELIAARLRWRSVAPNLSARLKCVQVAHFSNLLDWPAPDSHVLRVRPENLFDPPSRAEMLDALRGHLGDRASTGDILKIEGGWAVCVGMADDVPEVIRGFTIRRLSREEIAELPPATQSGPKTISVSSPRIDAVSAGALKPSREQVKKHMESGGVLLNYQVASKPGLELAPGDIVAVRGGGAYRFEGIADVTKKGRVRVRVEILSGP